MDRARTLVWREQLRIDLLGDMRHDRREQLEDGQQRLVDRPLRRAPFLRAAVVESSFDPLQVVVAEGAPKEALSSLLRRCVVVCAEAARRPGDQMLKPGEQRAIGRKEGRRLSVAGRLV